MLAGAETNAGGARLGQRRGHWLDLQRRRAQTAPLVPRDLLQRARQIWADHHIGRLLDYLEESGQRENTMIILVSDNGASGGGGPNGSLNENKMFNGIPDDIKDNLAMLDELGGTKTYNHYPSGWAMAFNTPFKMWKR